MSDALYLSLWYPNLRLEGLADKLVAVLGEFAKHSGEPLVYAATVWPVSWHEAPVFQRVWGRVAGPAVAVESGQQPAALGIEPRVAVEEALELLHDDYAYEFQIGWSLWELETATGLDPRWARVTRLVRVTGFGPLFEEEAELDSAAARYMAENVRQLVELTNAVEKASGATARLLWSELGESLAQRLAARLSQGN
jgi:hypothetical protein